MVHQYMPAVLCGKQQQKSSDAICNCKNKVQFPFFFCQLNVRFLANSGVCKMYNY